MIWKRKPLWVFEWARYKSIICLAFFLPETHPRSGGSNKIWSIVHKIFTAGRRRSRGAGVLCKLHNATFCQAFFENFLKNFFHINLVFFVQVAQWIVFKMYQKHTNIVWDTQISICQVFFKNFLKFFLLCNVHKGYPCQGVLYNLFKKF